MKICLNCLVIIVCVFVNTIRIMAQTQDSTKATVKAVLKDTLNNVTSLSEVTVHAPKIKCSKQGSPENGYKIDSVKAFGPFSDLGIQKTPLSLHVVSKEEIENREAHTSAEVFKTNPIMGVLMSSNTYCSMSRLQSRGFSAADQSVMRDGLCDRGFTYEPVENVEDAVVLNGLSSFLYGFGTIGGVINYISKGPTETSQLNSSAGVYNGGIVYLHGDYGSPIGKSDAFGIRSGAYHEEGETSIKDSREQRNLFYGGIKCRIFKTVELKANGYYQKYFLQGLSNYILPNPSKGIDIPDAKKIDPDVQYGQKWTYDDAQKYLMSIRMNSRLNDIFDFRGAFQFGDMWREYNRVNCTLTDNNGNYTEAYTGTPRQKEFTRSAYAYVDAKFDTWQYHHELTFGYTGAFFDYARGNDTIVTLGGASVAKQPYYAIPAYPTKINSDGYTFYDNCLIGDKISMGEKVIIMGGVNYAQIRSKSWIPNIDTQKITLGVSQMAWTPSISASVTPYSPITFYGNYMEGLNQGGTAGTTFKNINLNNTVCPVKNARQMLSPSKNQQVEAGFKGALLGLNMQLDYFYTNVINEYVDPTDSIYKQDGRQVSRGVELTSQGKLFHCITITGGGTWLNAEYRKVKNNPSYVDNPLINVPDKQARAYVEYLFPKFPLCLSCGANYYGRRSITVPKSEFLPHAITYDAGLRFERVAKGHKVGLNVNVSNLMDKRYWANYRDGEGLEIGQGRIISAALKVQIL